MATTDGRGGGGRTILIIVLVVVLLAVIAYAMGLFNVDATGELKAPDVDVSVQGGEVPDVQVEGADVDVGTETTTIETPTIDVTPAGDDGSAKQ